MEAILSWTIGLLTSKYFIAYSLLNYYWVYNTYNKTLKSFGRKNKEDIARDEKYAAFKRNDI